MEKEVIENILRFLCFIFGGVAGYIIRIIQVSSQTQKARDNANQVQISNVNIGSNNGK